MDLRDYIFIPTYGMKAYFPQKEEQHLKESKARFMHV
jgi:hypothetical protein